MMAGDDQYLMPRDRGPVKGYIRDLVDSRRNLLGLFMPLAILIFVALLVPDPRVQSLTTLLCLAMLVAMILEGLMSGRRITKLVREKFPKEPIRGLSIGWYAFIRASQIRKLRVPKPTGAPRRQGVTDLGRDPLPLRGRAALVTGASRRAGIGYATARRLAAYGASVFVHHFTPHDAEQPWGADPGGVAAVVDGVTEALADPAAAVRHLSADLADPEGPRRVVEAALAAFGRLDVAGLQPGTQRFGDGPLAEMDAARLDAHWAVNARASILLARSFAAAGGPGRIVFLTSGQNLGPMRDEVAYAASKGALSSITATLADELAGAGITVNAVNPGRSTPGTRRRRRTRPWPHGSRADGGASPTTPRG